MMLKKPAGNIYYLKIANRLIDNNEGEFTGETASGVYWTRGNVFQVLILGNYVIKKPIKESFSDSLKHSPKVNTDTFSGTAKLQNELHKEFPENTIPCYHFEHFLVSPIPSGNLAIAMELDKEIQDRLKLRLLVLKKKMLEKGFQPGDIDGLANYFYDLETDKLTIIDYSHLMTIDKDTQDYKDQITKVNRQIYELQR